MCVKKAQRKGSEKKNTELYKKNEKKTRRREDPLNDL